MREVEGILISSDKREQAPDLAVLFAALHGDQQARFFNLLAIEVGHWPAPACFQWRDMEDKLTPEGRTVIREMFEHTTPEGEQ